MIPGFSAESTAVVQGKSCVDRAVSHGFDVAMSGGSCGKDTSLAHLARWCLGPRTSAERNVISRRPKRSKKLNGMRNANSLHNWRISHEAAELFLWNQAARTDEKFPGTIHVSHHLALLHELENVFFCTQCGAVNAGGALRLLKSQCDGSGESRQRARRKLERGFMPNEHVMADAKRAF